MEPENFKREEVRDAVFLPKKNWVIPDKEDWGFGCRHIHKASSNQEPLFLYT